ncbi:MAG: addiction module protein [Planctomycetaceae bacterium]|jgi:putative addiction module component (TIGR02574 family)
MSTIEEILAAVRLLPGADRGRLIPLIWDEVTPEDWACPSAPWVAETLRRSAEIDQGTMATADWDVVRQRARKAAGLPE